ncbi:DUF6171 family protein [Paenibacillus hamazuiensis]|uniref:DUF6171 family protein n=1 Tax=Paenibacillus hamazuiensis TaxID=2936508 RepID=UPI00200EBFA1|nr:DUF6171 family protein [Paenibacillus hamazuiensis]
METAKLCRNCEENGAIVEERIGRMIAAARFAPEDCVSAEAYERRLQACFSCAGLAGGHTCTVCGCIVQIRAKLKAKTCPRPEGSLWD